MKSKKILIIDDEEMIVDLCVALLKNRGYAVTGASSGEEALRIASSETFHMVVTDMSMPGIDGIETFLALREKQPEIIGVLITGHGTMDTAIQAMERGLSGFIRKPFMPLELVQVVKDAFQRTALAEENTRLKTLIPLYDLGEKFISSRSREEILESLVETIAKQTGAQRLSVMLYDENEDCLRIVAAKGIRSEIIKRLRIKSGERISGLVFKDGKPLILNGGVDQNPCFKAFLLASDIVAAILYPLKARDRMLGVVCISKVKHGSPFSEADIEMVSILCRHGVMALENLKVMNEKAEIVRTRTLFEQYVAPEVAEILLTRGENLLEVGEIKNVTVLFADIRSFTALVQQLPLVTVRSFLNDFFGFFSEVIFKFKGTLNKFMGDAVLAFFGAPVPVRRPENAAVEAAILMHKLFQELKEIRAEEHSVLSQIGLGIGISSGDMFLGNVGSKRRLDYTVIGTPVNIAQRLASEANSGEILVTGSVRAELSPHFAVTLKSSRLLKGMQAPISVFTFRSESVWKTFQNLV